jgi:hypothetical protein
MKTAAAGILLIAALGSACGPSVTATLPGATASPPLTGQPTPPTGGDLDAAQLCAVFTDLAVGVLGGPVDAPQFGDVVPRPNGVYCRYSLTGNANTNVEVQVKGAPRSEAEALAATMGTDIRVANLGELAFRRDTSSLGGGGATLVAWSHDVLVTVVVNREGADQAIMNAAVESIARAVLLAAS